ncbi:Ig-like domain-containing protein [Myxococcus hansupus]|uniref:Ig-like domain-containing protein n=1 Tax=Pseudomyxococcus hansupus TaxID=1297742 RepID=UPI001D04725C|nr:Ig-like domain-containing protein [Myxococcus hansupus]
MQTQGPAYCREGAWTLSVSFEGATPERVQLITNDEVPTRLEAPYQHVVDCAAHAEGRFAFKARAWVDGKHVDAEAVAVTVDRTPPTVVSVKPGHSHPSVSSPMGFVFSEPILPESLQSEPARLIGPTNLPVPYQAVLRENGTVLELVPESLLQPPFTLYALELQTSLTDLAGNLLETVLPDFAHMHFADYWPFGRVTAPLASGEGPRSFVLESGDNRTEPIIGYTQDEQGIREPMVARWRDGAWQRLPPIREANTRTEHASEILVAQKTGVLVTAWTEKSATTRTIQLHVASYNGRAWQHLGAPHDTRSDLGKIPLALDEEGKPVIVVERNVSASETEVRVLRWTGSEWISLGTPFNRSPMPQVAIAVDATRVFVGWEEWTFAAGLFAKHIHVAAFENGRWTPVGTAIPSRANAFVDHITLAIQPDRHIFISWTENGFSHTSSNIKVSSMTLDSSQSNWDSPESVAAQIGESRYSELHLVVDNDGEPWLAWTERHMYISEVESYFRRRRATGWELKQFIAREWLQDFLLDTAGGPWALSGGAVVRPQ